MISFGGSIVFFMVELFVSKRPRIVVFGRCFYYNKNMKYPKKYLIETGIGLQDVDGLKNSSYYLNQAERYVKGEITLDELESLINSYYKNKPRSEDRTDEADRVSSRISNIVSDDSFTFTVGQIQLHKKRMGP